MLRISNMYVYLQTKTIRANDTPNIRVRDDLHETRPGTVKVYERVLVGRME